MSTSQRWNRKGSARERGCAYPHRTCGLSRGPAALAAGGRERGAARPLPLVPLAILALGATALAVALLLARRNPPAGEVFSQAAPAPSAIEVARAAVRTVAPPGSEAVPTPPAPGERVAATPTAAPAAARLQVEATPPIEQTYECRRGAVFGVDPEEAVVSVAGRPIGKADDWDDAGGGGKYEFARTGTYYVRFTLAGYRTAWIKVVVRPDAEDEYADVDLELRKLAEKD